MRRITIYTDEETAQKIVPWLEQQGVDFMSEDYAEPSLTRRNPPTRRVEPERHEASLGLLTPLKRPVRGKKKQPGPVGQELIQMLRECEGADLPSLVVIAGHKRWKPARVRDTLRRLKAWGHVHLENGLYKAKD